MTQKFFPDFTEKSRYAAQARSQLTCGRLLARLSPLTTAAIVRRHAIMGRGERDPRQCQRLDRVLLREYVYHYHLLKIYELDPTLGYESAHIKSSNKL